MCIFNCNEFKIIIDDLDIQDMRIKLRSQKYLCKPQKPDTVTTTVPGRQVGSRVGGVE